MTVRILEAKQPYEEYYIKFNFENVLGVATISSAVVSALDSSDVDSVAIITDVAEQQIETPYVNVWVQGGVTGETYTITCKIVTSTGEKYELECRLPIVEVT